MRWAAALAVVLIGMTAMIGCATVPELPSKGGAPWRELKSQRITLWTNVSSERAAELFQQIEQRRQIIARAMNRAEQLAPIFVIALRSTSEVKAFIADLADAVAWNQRNPTFWPGVLVAADYSKENEAILFNHELAHAISYSIIPEQPPWLAEGLASYFEMASLEGSTAQIGIPRAEMVHAAAKPSLMRMKDLMACMTPECRTSSLYLTGWALLSYLINTDLERFNKYLQRLSELPVEAHARVWRETFPELSYDELDEKLFWWLKSGSLALPRIKVQVSAARFTERALGDADVLAARGLLYMFFGTEQDARTAVNASLALDRTNLLAGLLTPLLKIPFSLDDARKLVVAHPDDWRALVPLAKELPPGIEANEVNARVCVSIRVAYPEACQPE